MSQWELFVALLVGFVYNRNYNKPTTWQCCYNQWLHAGFMWGWYSYEWYAAHQRDLPVGPDGKCRV